MTDKVKKLIEQMCHMQDTLNKQINPNWVDAKYEWYRASWLECAELMEHCGWKWWKKQTFDKNQAIMELIDIWHFGLSQTLVYVASNEQNIQQAVNYLNNNYELAVKHHQNNDEMDLSNFKNQVELFVKFLLENKDQFPAYTFSNLLLCAGLKMEDVYVSYIGKNVLNKFRQDNGYKTGTYVKIWNDEEDNEVLTRYLNKLLSEKVDLIDFEQLIEQHLTEQYNLIRPV